MAKSKLVKWFAAAWSYYSIQTCKCWDTGNFCPGSRIAYKRAKGFSALFGCYYDRAVLHVSPVGCNTKGFNRRRVFCTDGRTVGEHLPGKCAFRVAHE